MTIVQISQQGAEVQAQGTAKSATMSVSGSVMEMLATVYTLPQLAAVREAIQNACDAARRAGLSFAEGVLVTLPTRDNPVFMVTDKGSGMTAEFMDTTYLSFGTSTKSKNNGAAGGLGVGRWAAYGYIRECVITTCHASDMQERTYFQFQGEDEIPQVQLASTVPSEEVGTKVSFPVKESDIEETYRIVCWLKEIMQLTMRDSFSVDAPTLLPTGLIEEHFSGTILELGDFDPSLKGVRVFPMTIPHLMYTRGSSFDVNSLLVLTNQEEGVGGLPFRVKWSKRTGSIFDGGMIVEIPMSFNVSFMPSREDLKYTDEVLALLDRIDFVAGKAVVARVKELYSFPDMASKVLLFKLLGKESQAWHYFSRAIRISYYPLYADLKKATGGAEWQGKISLHVSPDSSAVSLLKEAKLSVTSKVSYDTFPLRTAEIDSKGQLCIRLTRKGTWGSSTTELFPVTFEPEVMPTIIYDDLASGGLSRTRALLNRRDYDLKRGVRFVYVKAETPSKSKDVADALNATYGGTLPVYATSSLPEAVSPSRVVGSLVIKSDGVRVTYYDTGECRQQTEYVDFSAPQTSEPIRYWVCKDGVNVEGFSVPFTEMMGSRGDGTLARFLASDLRIGRLYLLTPNQRDALIKQLDAAKAEGLFDMDESDFSDDAQGYVLAQRAKELKTWTPLKDGIRKVVRLKSVQSAMEGKNPYSVNACFSLIRLCEALAGEPRLELKGTNFDRAIAPFVDVISGNVQVLQHHSLDRWHVILCNRLERLGDYLANNSDAPEEHRALKADLQALKESGSIDYREIWEGLKKQFPLLSVIDAVALTSDEKNKGIPALCSALAAVYH